MPQFPAASISCTASRMNAVSLQKEMKHLDLVLTIQISIEIPREHRTAVIAENPSQCCLSTRPSPTSLDLEVSACLSEARVCILACTMIETYHANCIWAKVPYKFTLYMLIISCTVQNLKRQKYFSNKRAQKHRHFQNTITTSHSMSSLPPS